MKNQSSARKQKKKRSRVKRILAYSGITLGVIVCAAGGIGWYEYKQLQPDAHFSQQNIPVISEPAQAATKTSKSKTKDASNTTQMSGTFNLLLIGSDARPGQTVSHTDSMVLVHVDLNNHTYNMISIPRDTRVYMPGVGYTKLTSVQLLDQAKEGTQAGIISAVKAIGNLIGVPINYYAETDYWGLQDMVNVLGGINMDLPFPVTLTHSWYPQDGGKQFAAGSHFLDGQMVTEVVHERYSVPGTDYGRQELQEAALIGIAKAALRPENITK